MAQVIRRLYDEGEPVPTQSIARVFEYEVTDQGIAVESVFVEDASVISKKEDFIWKIESIKKLDNE